MSSAPTEIDAICGAIVRVGGSTDAGEAGDVGVGAGGGGIIILRFPSRTHSELWLTPANHDGIYRGREGKGNDRLGG